MTTKLKRSGTNKRIFIVHSAGNSKVRLERPTGSNPLVNACYGVCTNFNICYELQPARSAGVEV